MNSSKKRTKNFCPSWLGQKSKFSSSSFGRIDNTRISFWDYLTFGTKTAKLLDAATELPLLLSSNTDRSTSLFSWNNKLIPFFRGKIRPNYCGLASTPVPRSKKIGIYIYSNFIWSIIKLTNTYSFSCHCWKLQLNKICISKKFKGRCLKIRGEGWFT